MEHTSNQCAQVLIIGGGFAGLSCAQKLANQPGVEVTLVDKENHHLFQPLLYQVATTSLAAPDIARSLRQILSAAKNVTVLMDEILSIDRDNQTASSTTTTYQYDYLLLASGMQTSYFGNDHWQEHTLGLKTMHDALTVRKTVLEALERAEMTTDPVERQRLMTIAIVGGGPTGVELAGAYSDLARRALKSNFRRIDINQLRVCLIEGGERILAPFDPDQSEYSQARLERLGVELILGQQVTGVEKHCVQFAEAEPIHAETIIWAAGVQATDVVGTLTDDTDRAGRISPTPDLSLPDYPSIFVAGDITAHTDAKGKMVPGLAPAASQMGAYIAKRILWLDQHPADAEYPPYTYLDKGMMAIVGKNTAIVKMGNLKLRGKLAWLAWLFIHLLFLVGFRSKLSVILSWGWAYIKDKPGARVFNSQRSIEP